MVCRNATEKLLNHRIIIDNVKNGDILNYSLLICKGHIENLDSSPCAPLSHLTIKTTPEETPNQATINPNKTFKFLIDLKPGSNIIELSFCCTSTHITLEHKLRPTNLSVVPLYIICEAHDGKFQAPETEVNTPESACKRILTGCKLIQSVFAEKLNEYGFGRKTFQLGSQSCLVFRSALTCERVYKMGSMELWYSLAREIMGSSIGCEGRKYLAFLSCTRYKGGGELRDVKDHGELVGLTEGYVAFGGEDLALLGTACLYTWPESVGEVQSRFQDDSTVDASRFMDDSCFRGTLGGCFATTLGASLHELCHTFGLGHTDSGIMGRGFDNIQNVFLPNSSISICDINPSHNRNQPRSCIKNNLKNDDGTHWTENCLVLLSYHKWFNNLLDSRRCTLQYDSGTRIIKSTAGLRLVEVRRETDEMVLKYWVFTSKVLKYSYQITEELNMDVERLIVVEDNDGNILKQKL